METVYTPKGKKTGEVTAELRALLLDENEPVLAGNNGSMEDILALSTFTHTKLV